MHTCVPATGLPGLAVLQQGGALVQHSQFEEVGFGILGTGPGECDGVAFFKRCNNIGGWQQRHGAAVL